MWISVITAMQTTTSHPTYLSTPMTEKIFNRYIYAGLFPEKAVIIWLQPWRNLSGSKSTLPHLRLDLTLNTLCWSIWNQDTQVYAHTHTHIRNASSHTDTHLDETILCAWACTHTIVTLLCNNWVCACVLLRSLLGGLPSSHDHRNLVCQLAVGTLQVSPQHKSKVKG